MLAGQLAHAHCTPGTMQWAQNPQQQEEWEWLSVGFNVPPNRVKIISRMAFLSK